MSTSLVKFACIAVLAIAAATAQANIDLEWRPLQQTVNVGDPCGIGVYAVSDDPEMNQDFNSVQTIITWDISYLRLTGCEDDLWSSAFIPNDSFGLNEADPPADGDGLWTGMVLPGSTMPATPAGTLLTTIMFEALAETPETLVTIHRSYEVPPHPEGHTKIISDTYDVLGEVGDPAAVEIVPEPTGLSLLVLGAVAVLRRH